jgi:hypothetical protein
MEDINYEITPEICDEAITQEIYIQVGFKTSICILVLNTGFEAVGSYSPIDVQDMNIANGKKYSREEALRKAIAHLSAINQWKKAIADIREAELKAKEESTSKENAEIETIK